MTYTDQAREYMSGLAGTDLERVQPILDLFESKVAKASAGLYAPNILILNVDDKPALAISPRKQYISFYVWSMQTLKIFRPAMDRLGKHNAGKGCIRFRKLSDIDMDTLGDLFEQIGRTEHESGFGLE